jgi:hypothetical protein
MFELTNQELEMVSGGVVVLKEAIAEASSSVVLSQGNGVAYVDGVRTILQNNNADITAISIATAIVY